ncbi:MAG: LLM class F420-dependent oxidoreductase [Dehalococcoidia bacterium]
MKFGVTIFPTHYSIGPAEVARAAEAAGLESLWFPEHTHIPTQTRFPMGDGTVPEHYRSTLDPFVALGAAASVTTTIKLATGIALIPQRDPITLAKEVATLDLISNGRVILGIGAGWNEPETRNHGTDFDHRFKVMRERILAMKQLWTKDEAEYHGETVDFGPTWSWPKPVQKPHPPIVVGGAGAHTLKRVIDYADGWMPIAFAGFDGLKPRIAELTEMAAKAGRPKPEVSVFGAPLDAASIGRAAEIGIDRIVWGLDSAPADKVLPVIEAYGKAAAAHR